MPAEKRSWPLLFVLLALVALAWAKPLEHTAQAYVDSGLQRALVTFASARALNAVISLAQSASVSVQVGAGVSAHPAAVLDPLDDLVEQFSSIMLVAALSFAAQNIFIDVVGAWPLSALLTLVVFFWCLFIWRKQDAPAWLQKFAITIMFVVFVVPVASVASELTYRLLMVSSYENAQNSINAAASTETTLSAGEDFGQKLKRLWSQGTDLKKQADDLGAKANALVEDMIRLAALFIVQTVVLPLFFIWLMFVFYRALVFR